MGSARPTFEERFPVIRGSWLEGNLVYHCREEGYTRWLDADGRRVTVFDSETVVRWEVRTCCGILLDWWTWDRDNRGSYTTLSAAYADAIARPCRRCFEVESETSE